MFTSNGDAGANDIDHTKENQNTSLQNVNNETPTNDYENNNYKLNKTLPDDNNNNNSINTNNNNKNSKLSITQPIKVPSKSNQKSQISPPSQSSSNSNSYQQNYDSSFTTKRKNGNYKNSHDQGNYNTNGNNLNDTNPNNANESCFNSVNCETIKDEEFDFEKNLKLFNKNAFYEEIEGHQKPDKKIEEPLNAFDTIMKQLNGGITNTSVNSNGNGNTLNQEKPTQRYHQISLANLFSQNGSLPHISITPVASTSSIATPNSNSNSNLNNINGGSLNSTKNYRYDEMVLDTGEPVDLQQINVPCNYIAKRYVTDDGLIVPCIDYDLRNKIFEQSYKFGFSKQRQIECIGRSCVEMALQLVGGPIRFSPKNNHQKPSILVLANSQDIKGVYVLCAARMLLIRGVKIYLYINSSSTANLNCQEDSKYFQDELNLLKSEESSGYTFLNSVEEIKNLSSIDLIVNGIDSSSPYLSPISSQHWYRSLVRYIENCKASVLAIDPNTEGSAINSKWCVLPVLPMAMSNNCGRVYLCDLGFTKSIFKTVNIKYQSPFGAKFLIPLHND